MFHWHALFEFNLMIFREMTATSHIKILLQVWDYTGLGYTKYHARDVSKELLG